jgi:hypothetical protein
MIPRVTRGSLEFYFDKRTGILFVAFNVIFQWVTFDFVPSEKSYTYLNGTFLLHRRIKNKTF